MFIPCRHIVTGKIVSLEHRYGSLGNHLYASIVTPNSDEFVPGTNISLRELPVESSLEDDVRMAMDSPGDVQLYVYQYSDHKGMSDVYAVITPEQGVKVSKFHRWSEEDKLGSLRDNFQRIVACTLLIPVFGLGIIAFIQLWQQHKYEKANQAILKEIAILQGRVVKA